MDLIQSSKVKSIAILVLLVINIGYMMVIWKKLPSGTAGDAPSASKPAVPESSTPPYLTDLLQLNSVQQKEYAQIKDEMQVQTGPLHDSIAILKNKLANMVFADSVSEKQLQIAAAQIGELQSRIEIARVKAFRKFIQECTQQQRDLFKPLLVESFAKRPPKDEVKKTTQPRTPVAKEKKEDALPDEFVQEQKNNPVIIEKLEKYTRRLNLSAEQQLQVQSILINSKAKGEALRAKRNPNPSEVEIERNLIRDSEDKAILGILTSGQREEFIRMIEKRNERQGRERERR